MNDEMVIDVGPDDVAEAMHEYEMFLTAILKEASAYPLTPQQIRDLAAALRIKSPV